MPHLDSLSRKELLTLLRMHAKNWLAHDGCWFLAAEERLGLEAAMELDARAWERFSPVEAERIMAAFDIPSGGGLDSLERALPYRLYATVNPQAIERPDDETLIYKMVECRVQAARRRKGLPDFPCKPVGLIEHAMFAQTIDARIRTRCLQCPPDRPDDPGCICAWEFTMCTDRRGDPSSPRDNA